MEPVQRSGPLSHPSDGLMAGVSGIRGIAGTGLTADIVFRYATVYSDLCAPGIILVGRDPRASSGMVREAVITALRGAGRDVVDLEIVPTPTLFMNTALMGAAGGVMITASHNPEEWNGLKFADPRGRYLSPGDTRTLIDRVRSAGTDPAAADRSVRGGLRTEHERPVRNHTDRARAAAGVDIAALAGAGLTVVLDACNGAGSTIIPEFLERCGVRVHRIHCTPDGTFPRPPEPLPEALFDLGDAVRRTGAHLGLAVDPDADRLALTGPDGEPLGEERTLALAARQVLRSGAGPVVTNLSTSRMLDDVAEEAGVRLFRTPVGEINVAEMMETTRAVIGGEGNGGVIHPDVVLGRDALTGAAVILSALAGAGGDVGVLVAAIPTYAMLKRKYRLPEGGAEVFRERLSRSAGALGSSDSDLRDGLRLEWPDRWVHLRPSNTEPVARLIVEAPSSQEAAGLADRAAAHFDLSAGAEG